ncbi:serine/threonine-protein kinase [Nocardia iowensis]|uniref:non-specific serine/threonine protein kinase n=1 Tax=Nocardia iowensis TaxID=204891 RepID=A0ABX8RZ77_NOCIO|nr:serine/threonine-protein kinase [Nocardia iowensis]QXN94157.1 serine/threonine protein kinase [Nocardia iowensis]
MSATAVRETVDALVLKADTVEDFLEVMRAAQAASGLAPGQIAKFTNISRSSIYNWLRPGYPSLPRNRAQMESFFRVCKLSDGGLHRVLELWDRLDEARTEAAPSISMKAVKAQAAHTNTGAGGVRAVVADPVQVDNRLSNDAAEPAVPVVEQPKRAWQFSSIITAVATVAVIVVMLDVITTPHPDSTLSTAAGPEPLRAGAYAAALVCALLMVGLGAGERNRRMAWARLRNWPAVIAMVAMSSAAVTAVAPYAADPMVAAPITAVVGSACTAWWFASLSMRGVRLLITEVPVVSAVCALVGAIPGLCLGTSGLPMASAVLAGVLASASVVHLFGNAAAALAEPVGATEFPRTAPPVELPEVEDLTAPTLVASPPAQRISADSSDGVAHRDARPTRATCRRRRHHMAHGCGADWLHPRRFCPAVASRSAYRAIRKAFSAVLVRRDTAANGDPAVVPRTARDLIDTSTQPLPKLPRRKPRSRDMHELLVGVTSAPKLGARRVDPVEFGDEPVEYPVPAYEIIERIKQEREQAAEAEAEHPFVSRPRGLGRRTGTRFGPYELRSLVGKGRMGEVYEAYDTVKDRMVAVKLLSEAVALDPVYQLRFRRETLAAARLTEPHVIPIHDWGVINGVLFTDTRLVDGTDVRTVLRHHGPLHAEDAVAIIEQIAAALDAAHAAGLVHRDVKPADIVLTTTGIAYLTDFGIAHMENDRAVATGGMPVDSCDYLAPERFGFGPVHGSSDIYALTCVLYEALTGLPPFPAGTTAEVIQGHLADPPPRPSLRLPKVPAAMDKVIQRGMAKDPAERFPTATAMARAARVALGTPMRPRTVLPREKIVLPRREPGTDVEYFDPPRSAGAVVIYSALTDEPRAADDLRRARDPAGVGRRGRRVGSAPNSRYRDTEPPAEPFAAEERWNAWRPWRPTV